MTELIERIGASTFLQVSIEGWNELILLLLILIMTIGARQEKTDESRLDSFTEKKENRYKEAQSDTRSGSSYSYSYGKSTEKKQRDNKTA